MPNNNEKNRHEGSSVTTEEQTEDAAIELAVELDELAPGEDAEQQHAQQENPHRTPSLKQNIAKYFFDSANFMADSLAHVITVSDLTSSIARGYRCTPQNPTCNVSQQLIIGNIAEMVFELLRLTCYCASLLAFKWQTKSVISFFSFLINFLLAEQATIRLFVFLFKAVMYVSGVLSEYLRHDPEDKGYISNALFYILAASTLVVCITISDYMCKKLKNYVKKKYGQTVMIPSEEGLEAVNPEKAISSINWPPVFNIIYSNFQALEVSALMHGFVATIINNIDAITSIGAFDSKAGKLTRWSVMGLGYLGASCFTFFYNKKNLDNYKNCKWEKANLIINNLKTVLACYILTSAAWGFISQEPTSTLAAIAIAIVCQAAIRLLSEKVLKQIAIVRENTARELGLDDSGNQEEINLVIKHG
ncbi:MAG: hypothetical protein Tsb005_16730 [Gammaproteobacteria bacterium]